MDRIIRKLRPLLLSWLHRSRSGQVSLIRRLSYKDVKRATDGFHRVIYRNGNEAAYKARFGDGEIALVKEVKGFDQDKDLFYREVQLLACLHHRHILALRGFSIGRRRLMVFDNIENGSLQEHLRDPLRTPLNWKTRLQIAVGVTAALEYLFLFSDPKTYHASVSSSNVMLDDNFIAKVSDVRLLDSVVSADDRLDQKGENIIFQLGVLILELVTGQSSVQGSTDLIQWIQESRLSASTQKMIDPDLGNNYDSGELKNMLAVAKLCIRSREKPKFCNPQIFRFLHKKLIFTETKYMQV